MIKSVMAAASPGTYSFVIPGSATLEFDAVGRPNALHEGGLLFARGHDGRWMEKHWRTGSPSPSREHRLLSPSEKTGRERRVRGLLEKILQDFPSLLQKGLFQDLGARPSSLEDWRRRLGKILAFQERLDADAARYARIYHPIGVLPPDQYLSWIVQATEGCPWNRCAFCDLYRDRPARIRSRVEIRRHMEESEAYFGPAMDRRTSVFIGDADAFAAPPATLVGLCREIGRRQPRLVRPSDDGAWGIHSFGEARSVLRWPADRLRALARAGFRRATIGVESGDDGVRAWLKKPGCALDVRRAVVKLKAAGLSAGVVVLLGAGGREGARAHTDGTVKLLSELPLDGNDLVLLSPLSDRPGDPHRRALAESGRTPVNAEERAAQETAFRGTVRSLPDGRRPRAAYYDVEGFLY